MKKIYLILAIAALSSCKKDEEVGPQETQETAGFSIEGRSGFLISNEGQFQAINASVSFYDVDSEETFNGIYGSENDLILGDVLNSMTKIDDLYYLVVNNSGKIVYTDSKMEIQGEITGLTSPRNISKVNATTALVSDLFSNEISIVDLSSHEVTGTISANGWTEHIFVSSDHVFISDHTNAKITVYNPSTLEEEGEIQFTGSFTGLCQSPSGDVIVMNQDGDANNFAVTIDGSTAMTTDTLDLENNAAWASHPMVYQNGMNQDILVYALGDIRDIPLAGDGSSEVIIDASEISVYGIDRYNNQLIVSDAGDFTTNGKIQFYSSNGTWIKEIETGVSPNGILEY